MKIFDVLFVSHEKDRIWFHQHGFIYLHVTWTRLDYRAKLMDQSRNCTVNNLKNYMDGYQVNFSWLKWILPLRVLFPSYLWHFVYLEFVDQARYLCAQTFLGTVVWLLIK